MFDKQSENGIQSTELSPFDIMSRGGEETKPSELEDILDQPGDVVEDSSDEDLENPEIQDEEPLEVEDQKEKEEPDPDDFEVKVKANLAKYAAEAFKSRGDLPEDFEITDDITEEQLDEAYISYKETSLRNQLEQEVKRELAESEGLTPQMIEEIKLKHYGVQDPELQKLQYLRYLSSYEFDENSEVFEDNARDFLTSYYSLKNISESRVKKMVEVDLQDEAISQIITEAQTDLKGDESNLNTQIQEQVAKRQEARVQKKAEVKQSINTLLDSKTIGGTTYSDEEIAAVKKALFQKTETVVGADGKHYRTTLYNKRRMEASQSLEKDLQNKINFILGSDPREVRKTEATKERKKIMNRLNDYIDVDIKSSKKKRGNKSGIESREIN